MIVTQNGEVLVKLHISPGLAAVTAQEWNAALMEAIKVLSHPEQSLITPGEFTVFNLAEIMQALQFQLPAMDHKDGKEPKSNTNVCFSEPTGK